MTMHPGKRIPTLRDSEATHAKTFVVGIAGGSASGKSTLTAALIELVESCPESRRCTCVSLDKYAVADRAAGPQVVLPSSGESLFNFNHPDAYDTDRICREIATIRQSDDAPDILIVEGLMTLHIERIREELDLKVFVDLDSDIRALRRLLRDIKGGRASTDPEFIAEYYLCSARVGHERYVEPSRKHAHFVVGGGANIAETTTLIRDVINARLHQPASSIQ